MKKKYTMEDKYFKENKFCIFCGKKFPIKEKIELQDHERKCVYESDVLRDIEV